jgi:hypothetical protein
MRRRLINFAGVLSLVLLMATVALWVRSFYHCDELSRMRDNWTADARGSLKDEISGWWVVTSRGALEIYHQHYPPMGMSDGSPVPVEDIQWSLSCDQKLAEHELERYGDHHSQLRRFIGFSYVKVNRFFTYASLPLWSIASALAVPAILLSRISFVRGKPVRSSSAYDVSRLLNYATALSLVLLVATAALWVRSYFHSSALCRPFSIYFVEAYRGFIVLSEGETYPAMREFDGRRDQGWTYSSSSNSWPASDEWKRSTNKGGFGTIPRRYSSDPRHSYFRVCLISSLIVPFYAVAVTFAVLPSFWGWRWVIRRRRRPAGCCRRCSYDLTGNISGVCPECGSTTANA